MFMCHFLVLNANKFRFPSVLIGDRRARSSARDMISILKTRHETTHQRSSPLSRSYDGEREKVKGLEIAGQLELT